MPRQLLTTVRRGAPDEDLNAVDQQGLGLALQELAAAYGSKSIPEVTPDAYVRKTKAVDEAGEIVGFNYYLMWGEPPLLGPMQKEPA